MRCMTIPNNQQSKTILKKTRLNGQTIKTTVFCQLSRLSVETYEQNNKRFCSVRGIKDQMNQTTTCAAVLFVHNILLVSSFVCLVSLIPRRSMRCMTDTSISWLQLE